MQQLWHYFKRARFYLSILSPFLCTDCLIWVRPLFVINYINCNSLAATWRRGRFSCAHTARLQHSISLFFLRMRTHSTTDCVSNALRNLFPFQQTAHEISFFITIIVMWGIFISLKNLTRCCSVRLALRTVAMKREHTLLIMWNVQRKVKYLGRNA